jgi:NAD(P)-dependent dehydrogenase (short-subunit alcohol dehydrogenase family)
LSFPHWLDIRLCGELAFRHAAYNVSKTGAHMLTKCLAAEWAEHNILVNGVAPGFVTTEVTGDVVHL